MSKLKIGKLSKNERTYIADHVDKKSVSDIAKSLNRSVETVKNEIAKLGLTKTDEEVVKLTVLNQLHASMIWIEVSRQLSKQEIKVFENHWLEMYEQFKDDVWFTEKTQIRDFIIQDIFMSRNMQAQIDCTDDIEQTRKTLDSYYSIDPISWTQDDRNNVFNLESRMDALRQANETRQAQYLKLSDSKQKILERLKATRSQRIDKINIGKGTFVGLLKRLEEEGQREAIGREVALANKGADKAADKFKQNHTYEDGEVDRPFLTPESVTELVTRLQDDDVNLPKDLGDGDKLAEALVGYLTFEGKEKLIKAINKENNKEE